MKSSEVKIFSVILVIAVILVGFAVAPVLMNRQARLIMDKPQPQPTLNRKTLVTPGTFERGDPKATTTIVIFSDFECPSCKEGAPTVDEILVKHKGQVKTVFHHFQVRPEHVHSRILSRAAEAAGEQGKFWEMHDILFDKQKELSGPVTEDQALAQIREYAKAMHLDMLKFDASMLKKNDKRFDDDNQLGAELGIKGTPTYFVIDPQGKVVRYDSTAGLKEWERTLPAQTASGPKASPGERGKCLADMKSLSDTLEMYKLDIGHYPPTKPGLEALVTNAESAKGWVKPYINRIPVDPWGTPYKYACPGTNGKDFDLSTTAPDGEVIVGK